MKQWNNGFKHFFSSSGITDCFTLTLPSMYLTLSKFIKPGMWPDWSVVTLPAKALIYVTHIQFAWELKVWRSPCIQYKIHVEDGVRGKMKFKSPHNFCTVVLHGISKKTHLKKKTQLNKDACVTCIIQILCKLNRKENLRGIQSIMISRTSCSCWNSYVSKRSFPWKPFILHSLK